MPLALLAPILSPLLPALRFPRFRPFSVPFRSHFSALFPLPFRPPSSQPQLSSPTRPKIRPRLPLASRTPLGAGWREAVPPVTPSQTPPPTARPQPRPSSAPTSPRRPASRPGLATSPRQALTHSRHTPAQSVSPGHGPHASPRHPGKMHPAAPQEFFGKNSYCARDPPRFAPHQPPSPSAPCVPKPLSLRPRPSSPLPLSSPLKLLCPSSPHPHNPIS